MKETAQPAAAREIIEIVGPIEDAVLLQILEARPTAADVLEAFTWANADDQIGTELERGPRGAVTRVYEILRMESWNPTSADNASLAEIIRCRMLMIAAGCEDSNDADARRGDPMFKLALDRPPSDDELCAQSVLGLDPGIARLGARPSTQSTRSARHQSRTCGAVSCDGALSWRRVERIIARVEAGPEGTDTRFIVTNLAGGRAGRAVIYAAQCILRVHRSG